MPRLAWPLRPVSTVQPGECATVQRRVPLMLPHRVPHWVPQAQAAFHLKNVPRLSTCAISGALSLRQPPMQPGPLLCAISSAAACQPLQHNGTSPFCCADASASPGAQATAPRDTDMHRHQRNAPGKYSRISCRLRLALSQPSTDKAQALRCSACSRNDGRDGRPAQGDGTDAGSLVESEFAGTEAD